MATNRLVALGIVREARLRVIQRLWAEADAAACRCTRERADEMYRELQKQDLMLVQRAHAIENRSYSRRGLAAYGLSMQKVFFLTGLDPSILRTNK